jgi:hypothetical protein
VPHVVQLVARDLADDPRALRAARGAAEDPVAALRAAGIDPGRRGETLSLEEFARVADAVTAGQARS